jgi:gamma-glutamylcyclotransferase (GGCT)/AIG2-like uncharacterized protein YtfP
MNPSYLFVYGSLRRGAKNGMNRLLLPYGQFVADATYPGRLYRVANYPGAVPSDRAADVVHGEVWRLTCPQEAFARLDEYEECGPDFPEPTEYLRRETEVRLATGEIVPAWIYLYNRPTEGLELIEHGDFLRGETGPGIAGQS